MMRISHRVEPLRIACCLPIYRSIGTNDVSFLQQILIADQLRTRGHSITYIAPKDIYNTICTQDINRPRLATRTWSDSSWFTIFSKATWKIQKQLHIPYLNYFSNLRLMDTCLQCLPGHDIVQERNGIYKMGVAMACRRLGLPYVLFFDSDDVLEHDLVNDPITGLLRWKAQQVIRYNTRTASKIICVSGNAQSRLVNVWKVPEGKIEILSNGVDLSLFHPYPEERSRVYATYGVDEGPLIVYVGSFFPWQDVELLLRSFSQITRKHPEARLVLVGNGPLFSAMTQLAKDINIENSVRFAGFLPHTEISQIMGSADIAIAPYKNMKNEYFIGSPMKLFEYMASGLAVIATNLGQITEVIRSGENGLLVEAGNMDTLSNAFDLLIRNPDLRVSLGERARKDACEKYSWEKYITRLEDIYNEILFCRSKKRKREHELTSD
jgi:glycosyltransferase involved in cell wall biosynthesis